MQHGGFDRLQVLDCNRVIGRIYKNDFAALEQHGNCLGSVFVRDAMRRLPGERGRRRRKRWSRANRARAAGAGHRQRIFG
jgi:hypothetical protein